MKKKILTIAILILAVIISTQIKVFSTNLTIQLKTNRTSYSLGEKVITDITWSEGMQATEFTVKYDNTKLKYLESNLEDKYINTTENGEVLVSWASFEEKDITKVTLYFETIALGNNTNIQISSVEGFADGNLQSPEIIDYTTYGAQKISIVNYGDLNNDGEVNMSDVELITTYLEGTTTLTQDQLIIADVNLDGFVNSVDAYCIVSGEKLPIIYGDYTSNGVTDVADVVAVRKELESNSEFKGYKLISCDVNLDGVVDNLDLELIRNYCAGSIKLPVYYGDYNNDGILNDKDVSALLTALEDGTELSEREKIVCDVNLDGFVNKHDTTIMLKACDTKLLLKLPVYYGDFNGDRQVTATDRYQLSQSLDKGNELAEEQKIVCDVNLDGIVDWYDCDFIAKYVAKWDLTLPVYYGDVNLDGKINNHDLNRLYKIIYEAEEKTKQMEIQADINLDGIINSCDLNLLTLHLTGEPQKLPLKVINNNKLSTKLIDNIAGIYGIETSKEGTKISDFINSLTTEMEDIQVRAYKSGTEITDKNAIMSTGVVLKFYINEEIIAEYTVVIYGDTTGDGKINALDALAIIKDINNKIPLTSNIHKEAGKIMSKDEEKLTAVDALAIIKHSIGKYTIDQLK